MSINTTTSGYAQQAHAAPSFPFWQRLMVRVESQTDTYPLMYLSKASDTQALGLYLTSGGGLTVAMQTSWGGSGGLVSGVANLAGSNVEPILLEWDSLTSVTVRGPSNTTGITVNITNPNSSELSGIDTLTIGGWARNGALQWAGNGAGSYAEYAEGTGTLNGTQRTALLTAATAAEGIAGLTLTNVVPMNPAGASGASAAGALPSISGGAALTASAAVVVSSRAHPVTRASAPTLTSPTGTATGNTTANAGATIDAVSGSGSRIMYALARIGGSPASSATIISTGTQLAVTSAGAKSVALTGLTPSANYVADVVYVDATLGTSNVVTTGVFSPGAAPSITVQPTAPTVTVGATANVSVTATGSGTLSYQWQRQPAAGGGYVSVSGGSGGTSATYTTPATTISGGSASSGDTYRCVVTGDTAPPATSNAVALTVQQPIATTFTFSLNGGNSQTGLKYAVFDQVTPDLWLAPVRKASNGSSNGSGLVTVDVTGLTARRIGELGSAVLTNSDGTVTGGAQAATRKAAYYVGAFS